MLLVIPRSSLRLKPSYLPPVGIRLRDIVVDIGLETLQRVLIPTEIKPALVNGEGVRSLSARNDSVVLSALAVRIRAPSGLNAATSPILIL